MRLIDADEIRKNAVPHTRGEHGYCADIRKWAVLVGDIDDAPTIDPESLRKKGRWVETVYSVHDGYTDEYSEEIDYDCIVCDYCSYWKSPYCPNCGADMREG